MHVFVYLDKVVSIQNSGRLIMLETTRSGLQTSSLLWSESLIAIRTWEKFMLFVCRIWEWFYTLIKILGGRCPGLPRWPSGKAPSCQYSRFQRRGLDLWVGKILWSRKWQPTPVFLPGEPHGQRSLVGYISQGSQTVWHDWASEHACTRQVMHCFLVGLIDLIFSKYESTAKVEKERMFQIVV